MEISLMIRRRLEEMGLEQQDLARAAQVTEDLWSDPPGRTDLLHF